MFDSQLYRDKREVDSWRPKDPIVRFRNWLESNHIAHADDLARIESDVAAEIEAAITFSEHGTWEPVSELARFTYADRARP
jgi:TPP-dependent pyruvate/acetoin dehydrogenase alpha subunit